MCKYLITAFLSLSFLACGFNKTETAKTIVFPKNLIFFGEKDLSHNMRIISYLDGNCPSCLNELKKWLVHKKDFCVDVIFVIYAEDQVMLEYYLQKENINVPYYLDNKNEFRIINDLPNNRMFQTFLLNSEDKIELTGNPILDSALIKRYQNVLTKYCSSSK